MERMVEIMDALVVGNCTGNGIYIAQTVEYNEPSAPFGVN